MDEVKIKLDRKQPVILIIEDFVQIVESIRSTIEQDHQLLFATNSKSGLEIALDLSPDLILMDMMNPDMDGFEVSSILKDNVKTCTIPILLIIGQMDKDDQRIFQASVDGFFIWPIHPEILKTIVRSHLELKRSRDLLGKLIKVDSLTGLSNQQRLDDIIELEWKRAIRYQTPLSMILMDIDYFKSFNDYYGHLEGDVCLCRIASALTECVKRQADHVARTGGDEFACLLPDTNADGASRVVIQIQNRIDSLNIRHAYSPISDRITLSIGHVTVRPTLKLGMDILLQQAEILLEEAKSNGCNKVRNR